MAGFLDQFRQKVMASVWKESEPQKTVQELNDKIALGVLLWVVAEADEKFLPEEKQQMEKVLKEFGQIPEEDLDVVMQSIKAAAKERIDLYSFTHEVSQDLSRDVKIHIVENLFRIACIDLNLDENEEAVIRKIADLFRLDHKEFIEAKIKIKKEVGLDTAGL